MSSQVTAKSNFNLFSLKPQGLKCLILCFEVIAVHLKVNVIAMLDPNLPLDLPVWEWCRRRAHTAWWHSAHSKWTRSCWRPARSGTPRRRNGPVGSRRCRPWRSGCHGYTCNETPVVGTNQNTQADVIPMWPLWPGDLYDVELTSHLVFTLRMDAGECGLTRQRGHSMCCWVGKGWWWRSIDPEEH